VLNYADASVRSLQVPAWYVIIGREVIDTPHIPTKIYFVFHGGS